MKGILSFLVVVLALAVSRAVGQVPDYPVLRHVSVSARVVRGETGAYLYYSYTLTNNSQNTGSVRVFRIDISRDPGSVNFDTVGLQFAGNDYMEQNFRRAFPRLASVIVPVGFVSLPPGWSGLWGNTPWASLSKDAFFVPPGGTVDGFQLMSKGIPGIREVKVQPEFNVDRLFPSLDDTTSTITPTQMDSIRDAANYYGYTLGPWAPDSAFEPLAFVDTVSTFVHRSHALGWIADETVASGVLASLARARTYIVQGRKGDARVALSSILEAVGHDATGAFHPEGSALIRYNVQYLYRKLE